MYTLLLPLIYRFTKLPYSKHYVTGCVNTQVTKYQVVARVV